MQTIDGKAQIDTRAGPPRAARLSLCGAAHDYMTFSGLCSAHPEAAPRFLHCVIGTDYGYLHTSAGDIRTWRSASSARRAARTYRAIKGGK
jgi:hypothetical protein